MWAKLGPKWDMFSYHELPAAKFTINELITILACIDAKETHFLQVSIQIFSSLLYDSNPVTFLKCEGTSKNCLAFIQHPQSDSHIVCSMAAV